MSSGFLNGFDYLNFKDFPGRDITPKGFHSLQFKISTRGFSDLQFQSLTQKFFY